MKESEDAVSYKRSSNPGRSAYDRASGLIATVAGATGAVAIGPLIFAASIEPVRGYAAEHYPWLWDWVTTVFWAAISGLATFALTTLVLTVSIRIALAKLSLLIFRN